MAWERWGTFSVKDHTDPAVLVPEILLYDRLVLPTPPDDAARQLWRERGWQPDLLDSRIDQLGRLALRRPWGLERSAAVRERLDEIRTIEYNGREQAEAGTVLPYMITRGLLAEEEQRRQPGGPDGILVVAAYHSIAEFQEAHGHLLDRQERAANQLALLLSHDFVTPALVRDTEEVLQKTIELAKTAAFQEKRRGFYRWQEAMIPDIVTGTVTAELAVEQMRDLLEDYNRAVEGSVGEVRRRRVYTFATLAATAASLLAAAGGTAPLVTGLGLLAGGVQFAQFLNVDWAPRPEVGETRPAAMFHEIQRQL